MERAKLNICKYCSSDNIKKDGYRTNKRGKLQSFKCLEYKHKFTTNFWFENKQFSDNTITTSMQIYFSGMPVRDIVDHYEMLGIKISHVIICRWVSEYSKTVEKYLNEVIHRISDRTWVRADETWFKIAGDKKYLFTSIDDKTRYFLAYDVADTKFQHNTDRLLEITKNVIGKSPKHFTTDEFPAYYKSSKRVFGKELNIILIFTYVKIVIITRWSDLMVHSEIVN